MKLTRDNFRIISAVITSWMKSSFYVVFSKPSVYLSPIIHRIPSQQELSKQNRIMVRKIVRGTRKLSPLFRKSRRCLMEALIVHDSLRKFHIESAFKIGTVKSERGLEAHAWIEIEGATVIGGAIKGYSELSKIH